MYQYDEYDQKLVDERVAAIGFAFTSTMAALMAWVSMPAAVLIGVMSVGGLLNGMIQPSRDMMVRAVTPPGRAWRMIRAWATMVRETRQFAKRYFPDAAIILCGHFHRSGIWDEQLPVVINSGSFMPPGSAYWSEWKDHSLSVGIIQKKNGHWQRGALLAVWKLDA